MSKLDRLLTLQLRPHVAAMLDAYVETVRARLPENLRAKVTRSVIVRKLLARPMAHRDAALAYIGNRRFRDDRAVQIRVRCTSHEWESSGTDGVPAAKSIAARIVDAAHPDGNYPANPDSQTTQPTTETHHA